MTTMTFDKLAYIDRLKAAGFAEPQARAMADGLDQALREEVATKSDLAVLRAEFKEVTWACSEATWACSGATWADSRASCWRR